MTDQNFTARLAVLLGADILLAILDSYIPIALSPVRSMVAMVELACMIATMAIVVQNVLEDY